jgi:hypothetical protein
MRLHDLCRSLHNAGKRRSDHIRSECADIVRELVEAHRPGCKLEEAFERVSRMTGGALSPRRVRSYWHQQVSGEAIKANEHDALKAARDAFMEAEIRRAEQRAALFRARLGAALAPDDHRGADRGSFAVA